MRNTRSLQSGFSLVEVMCAILVLGVALVGLTQGVSLALTSNKEAELQTTAALLAAGLVETLRAEGDFVDGTTEGDAGESLPLYRWKQTISRTEIDGLHQVEVVVQNAKSEKTIYELQTLLFKPPEDTTSSADKRKEHKGRSKEGRTR
jgi:prepilin-type N-terminal cleavage/methylation domain-containing protein